MEFTSLVVLAKMAANAVMPGLGAAVDFAQAGIDLWKGDKRGALLNIVSGVADVCTLGLSSSVKGAMKESAKKWVDQVGKEAMKEVHERLGKELAQRLISESVKKVFNDTKKTAWLLLGDFYLKAISTGGKDVAKQICKGYFEDVIQLVFSQTLKQNPKHAFVFAKIAEELRNKDVIVAYAKGAINHIANGNEPTAEDVFLMQIAISMQC